MKFKAIKLVGAIALSCMLVLSGCSQAIDSTEKTADEAKQEKAAVEVIKLATEDWGYPSPFTHYSRGPGIYKMQMIFDSL